MTGLRSHDSGEVDRDRNGFCFRNQCKNTAERRATVVVAAPMSTHRSVWSLTAVVTAPAAAERTGLHGGRRGPGTEKKERRRKPKGEGERPKRRTKGRDRERGSKRRDRDRDGAGDRKRKKEKKTKNKRGSFVAEMAVVLTADVLSAVAQIPMDLSDSDSSSTDTTDPGTGTER